MDELESIRTISAWLQPTDYFAESSEYRRHLAAQAPGTGLWLRQTDEYRKWRDSEDCGSMWVKGVPGAGKSVIAASMIDLLRTPEQFLVLFFFFRQIVVSNHTPRSLMKDWLDQLLPHSSCVRQALGLLRNEDVVENCSDDQLWHILREGLASVPIIYCVVDALDEMDAGNEAFLSRLNDLAAFRPQTVKLLLTSRPKQYLQSALRNTHIVHVSLEKDMVESDIAAFVSHRLSEHCCQRLSEDQKHSLKVSICAKSKGLFLYARLILDQLLEKFDNHPIINTDVFVEALPVGLREMYNDMLYKQRTLLHTNAEVQIFLLRLVTCAARPLRLNELAGALYHSFRETATESDYKALARSACGPLLEILEDESVQIIHHSLTEFLCDSGRSGLPSKIEFPVLGGRAEQKSLLLLCLRYLRSAFAEQLLDYRELAPIDNANDDSETVETITKNQGIPLFSFDYQHARFQHTFLDYAVNNWIYHASQYNLEDQEVFDALADFLDPDHGDFQVWLWRQWGAGQGKALGRSRAYALHIAAFGGLTEFAKYLFTTGLDLDQRDQDGRTALHWASHEGHYGMAVALLEYGANADLDDHQGLKPLHEAAKKDHSLLVRLLLSAGVSIRTPKTKEDFRGHPIFRPTVGDTPLQYACEKGSTGSCCEMLGLMTQADLDEALWLAIKHNRGETVQAIFANAKPSPNATFDGSTALFIACAQHQEDTIRELLARGADASLPSSYGARPLPNYQPKAIPRFPEPRLTPIHGLILWSWSSTTKSNGLEEFRRALRLLMDANADIEARDHRGNTALHMAIGASGHRLELIDMVRTLLEHGADASAVNGEGDSVLTLVARGTDWRTLQMLLDHCRKSGDPDIASLLLKDVLSVQGDSDISDEEREDIKKCLKFLVQNGAECDFEALKSAFENGACDIGTLGFLLASSRMDAREKGLLFHHIGIDSQDPLAFIGLLLEHGADMESRNRRGQTPFLLHIETCNVVVATALLDSGARWDAVDVAGQNALWSCRWKANTKEWGQLVARGLDPRQPRFDGRNLLHHVAREFHGSASSVADLRLLIDLGLDVNQQDQNGSPPFHIRQEIGRDVGLPFSPSLLSVLQEGRQTLRVDIQDKDGFTALHLAAKHADIDVGRLLDAGADADLLTNEDENALHIASREGYPSTVGLLAEYSKTLMARRNTRGETPLHLACQSGRPESVYYLLKADGSTLAKDARGNTPLHSCALFARKIVCEGLDQEKLEAESTLRDLVKPPHNDQRFEKRQIPPLSIDSSCDTARVTDIVKTLLAHGADPWEENSDGRTPQELAILSGNLGMAEMLSVANPAKSMSLEIVEEFAQLKRVYQDRRHPILGLLDKEIHNNDLFSKPCEYSKVLTAAELGIMVTRWQREPEITKGPFSLINHLARVGQTELLEVIGSACKLYDDSDWIERHRDKDSYDSLILQPPLQAACSFSCNLPMLELLVDQYGVDVNAHHLIMDEQRLTMDVTNLQEPGPKLIPGDTALHCLAVGREWWQIGAIRWLVERGADVNSRNSKGETPLHVASHGNRTGCGIAYVNEGFWSQQCLKTLLDLGADPNAVDNDGRTCLNKAAREPKKVLELLARGASIDARTHYPLFSAIDCGNVDVAAILLEHGARIDAIDSAATCTFRQEVGNQLRTPLFCAAMCGRYRTNANGVSMTTLLLKKGADWKVKVNDKDTLVHHVFANARHRVISDFLAFPDIDTNLSDSSGRTLFLAAAEWGVRFHRFIYHVWGPKAILPAMAVLDHGADAERVDQDGRNALHYVLDNQNMATDVLLPFLHRPECQRLIARSDNHGVSPLHVALRHHRFEACDFLLSHGADLLGLDDHACTALHYLFDGLDYDCTTGTLVAFSHAEEPWEPPDFIPGALDLWRRYVAEGGDIDARDTDGNTPLFKYLASSVVIMSSMYVDKLCHINTLPVLLSDTDAFARNKAGETALHIVARRRTADSLGDVMGVEATHDATLFQLLTDKGLDPLAEDKQGRSALDVAAACGKTKILEVFQRGRKG